MQADCFILRTLEPIGSLVLLFQLPNSDGIVPLSERYLLYLVQGFLQEQHQKLRQTMRCLMLRKLPLHPL